ncbi:Mitochondrial import receptor subunit TOM20 [Heracleum sosnowskyi]|uniref:Mitochondrial import receptor subunit TOM20 n=1 Tax=Heracleum sosnowskyi TaxID=360622 RepID=A0AAD8I0A0_9APIA|nr:Mitochondrial import receptor subunit TOM20 [Heracleum sosnowskyi]
MEQPTHAEIERLVLFQQIRMNSEANYLKNPHDAENLTRWGGALLEISQYGNVEESKQMIIAAVSKFEEALEINPRKHDTLWLLGNAFNNQGILTPDIGDAQVCFGKARDYLEKAVAESPGNELYLRSLAATSNAPELHRQIHKQGIAAGPADAKESEKSNSDWIYDICGWIILGVGIFTWVAMAKSNVSPPHSR